MLARRAGFGYDAGLLWLACAAVACAGAYLAFGLLGGAVERQREATSRIADALLASARIAAQRPTLERAQAELDARLRGWDLHADKPALVARFIHCVTDIAAAQHVEIGSVDERTAPPVGPIAPAASTQARQLETIPFEVTLRGSYPEVLAAIRALAQTPVAMRLEIAALERTSAGGTAATAPLTARVHVELERLDASELPQLPRSPAGGDDVAIDARSR
jgi:hypothetical protein